MALVLLRWAKGMGHAYRTGIAASRGARVVLTADDLPFGFDDLEAAEGLDPAVYPVVIGSKGHRDSVVDRGLLRGLLSRGFWLLRRLVLGMRTLDPQGTFILAGDWAHAIAPPAHRAGAPGDDGAVLPRRALRDPAGGGAGPDLRGPPRPPHPDHRRRRLADGGGADRHPAPAHDHPSSGLRAGTGSAVGGGG